MDSRVCTVEGIDACIGEILNEYVGDCAKAVAAGVLDTTRQLKAETQATAPTASADGSYGGYRWPVDAAHLGRFRKAISYRFEDRGMTATGTWFVKPPDHRLTHLIVHGHKKFAFGRPVAGRTAGNPFLHEAVEHAEAALPRNVIKRIGEIR